MANLIVVVVAAVYMCSTALSTPIVFEDSAPGRSDLRQPQHDTTALQQAPSAAEGEGRIFHNKKKKKKKVICGIANLIAGRDAGGDPGREHRVARAAPQDPAQAQAQGRGLPPGTGIAGFILGALVGSHLGSPYAYPAAYPHAPPTQTQTQAQTQPGSALPYYQQVQVQAPAPVPVPVRPPVNPPPVHEDYDEVEDDPVAGGGGYSLCDQLQHRPDPGPLDSHFPLISGILSGGGGGGGGGGYQRPYRPAHQSYGHGGHQRPVASGSNLLYHYFKPWSDLLFK